MKLSKGWIRWSLPMLITTYQRLLHNSIPTVIVCIILLWRCKLCPYTTWNKMYCNCIYNEHLLLSQILLDLESLADNMPKIKRSNSEPFSLHYNHIPFDESFTVHSPHTPVQKVASVSSDTFQYYPMTTWQLRSCVYLWDTQWLSCTF